MTDKNNPFNQQAMLNKAAKSENLWKGIFRHDLGPWLFELILVSFFINVLTMATPIFVLQVYDRVVFKASLTTLQGLVIGMIVVIVFDFVLKMTRVRFFQAIAARNDMVLGEKIFAKLFHLPLRYMEEKAMWYWQSLFQDAALVRNVLSGATASLIIDLPFSFLFLLAIIIIAPPLWWIFIVAMVLFVLVAIISQLMIRHSTSRERQDGVEKEEMLADLLKHRESVNLLALQPYWKTAWIGKQEKAIKSSLSRGRIVDFFRTFSQSMMIIFSVTITSYGAMSILQQKMTIGTLIGANMLGSRLIQPFVQLVEQWRVLIHSRQALKRLNGFMDLPQAKVASAADIPQGAGIISFKDLRFNYTLKTTPSEHWAVDRIAGNIGPNGMHVLMGRNGSGKTTLLKLITGFYSPMEGEVKLDGADLRQFTPAQLHKKIGYLPQRIEMFQVSIFENIRMGCLSCDKDDVIAMAIKTGLHEQVIALTDGYDTVVGDDNRGLSGGLIQRIALTRTLLGDPQIIVLDEPTNNLDQQAEKKIISLLRDMARQHTVLVASHSPVLLVNADSIVILETGKVAVAGQAKAVLKHLADMENE